MEEGRLRLTVVLLGDGPGPLVGGDAEVLRAPTRRAGWQQAKGDVVAFFDTRYEADAEWEQALGTADRVGGFVCPGDNYDWAAWVYYVVEYGWGSRMAAGNVAYRRSGTASIDEWDPGSGLHDPRMDVRLARPPKWSAYLRERYRFSKMWGQRNVTPAAGFLRIGLPLQVLFQVPWWRKPTTLPGVFFISLVMASGEIAGSWTGGDGKLNPG